MLPVTIEAMAIIVKIEDTAVYVWRPEPWKYRSSNANIAPFETVAMYPAIGGAAPSYTSGVQKWKGTRASLNPKPVTMRTTPGTTR
jgi:hypothetical protein